MRMFEGELLPKMPPVPPEVHIRAGEQVPYTPAEIEKRTAAYIVKKATWEKSNKVNSKPDSALCMNVT